MRRIGLIGHNSVEYVNTLLSIWNSGNTAVLIDWKIPEGSIIRMLKASGVERCYVDIELIDKLRNISTEIDCVFYRRDLDEVLLPQSINKKYKPNYSMDEAIVLFSSGTTGDPKGIPLSHYAINTNADAIIKYMRLTASDSIYIVKSLCHSSTLVGELLVGIKAKAKVFLSAVPFSASKIVADVEKYAVTILCINPSLLRLLKSTHTFCSVANTKLKAVYVSGDVLPAILHKEASQIIYPVPILNMYGLTEAGPRVASQIIGDTNFEYGSVGRPIDNVAVKIGIKQDGGRFGNILIKTPSLYCNSTKLVKESLLWYNTGDIGYISEKGNLFVCGREDGVIVWNSHNIVPAVVEEEIMKVNSLIKDCIVLLIDNQLACQYISEVDTPISIVEIRHIINELSKKFASYEIPQKFMRVSTINYSNNGKKRRNK